MAITPERIQEMFTAVRLHLTGKYEYWTYGGKLSHPPPLTKAATALSYRIKTEEDILEFFLCNQVHEFLETQRLNTWLQHFANRESFKIWQKHKKLWNDKYNEFSKDFLRFRDINTNMNLAEVLKDPKKIFSLLLHNEARWTTIIMLMKVFPKLTEEWSNTDDPLIEEYVRFFCRVLILVDVDDLRIKQCILAMKQKESQAI
jgi:hypothetical protein